MKIAFQPQKAPSRFKDEEYEVIIKGKNQETLAILSPIRFITTKYPIEDDMWCWQIFSISGTFGQGRSSNLKDALSTVTSLMKSYGYVFIEPKFLLMV